MGLGRERRGRVFRSRLDGLVSVVVPLSVYTRWWWTGVTPLWTQVVSDTVDPCRKPQKEGGYILDRQTR